MDSTTATHTRPALPSPTSWRATAARLADERRIWTGTSGLTLTGIEIATHLTAARTWLASEGWNPREAITIHRALRKTSLGGDEDRDTRRAGEALLELLLHVQLNSPGLMWPEYDAWEARANRTWSEVDELLALTIQFAREHGPT